MDSKKLLMIVGPLFGIVLLIFVIVPMFSSGGMKGVINQRSCVTPGAGCTEYYADIDGETLNLATTPELSGLLGKEVEFRGEYIDDGNGVEIFQIQSFKVPDFE